MPSPPSRHRHRGTARSCFANVRGGKDWSTVCDEEWPSVINNPLVNSRMGENSKCRIVRRLRKEPCKNPALSWASWAIHGSAAFRATQTAVSWEMLSLLWKQGSQHTRSVCGASTKGGQNCPKCGREIPRRKMAKRSGSRGCPSHGGRLSQSMLRKFSRDSQRSRSPKSRPF